MVESLARDTPLADVVRPGRKVSNVVPYWYNIRFNWTASAAAQQGLIQTQADSDFLCNSIAADARLDATNLFDPMPLIWGQVTDQSSGKTFFSAPMITRIFAGNQGMPAVLAVPRLVRANTTLQVDVEPTDTRYNALWLSLAGARIFYEATS